jgi:choline dehydrogenase
VRGAGGRVHVDPAIYSYPLTEKMIAAGEALGMARVDDLNGSTGPRVGLYTHNIHKGKRQSAAVTFLAPARKRSNVRVVTHALAERVRIENGRATGVAKSLYRAARWKVRCCFSVRASAIRNG